VALVILGYVGARALNPTIHVVNPPPPGQSPEPMCGTNVGSDFRVRSGQHTEVNCTKCKGSAKTGIP
jgi:hypothetical protein